MGNKKSYNSNKIHEAHYGRSCLPTSVVLPPTFPYFPIQAFPDRSHRDICPGMRASPPPPVPADRRSQTSARDYGALLLRSLYCAMRRLSLIFLALGWPAGSLFLFCLPAYLLDCLPRCLLARVSACSCVCSLFSRRTCSPALAFRSPPPLAAE